ncbi:DNA-directed DNA polymerase II small subunit [Candidatus Bathyarchaeota archaeon]|nr:DNA-directed DNA polymerase II small subunit [Candidatus Bathyarchaeota archaeon]
MTQELQPILNRVIQRGYQLTPDAFGHLQSMKAEQVEGVVQRALQRAESQPELFIIDMEFLTGVVEEPRIATRAPGGVKPLAARVETSLEVLPVDESAPEGDVNGFIDYFNSRFSQLEAILKRRMDVRDAIPLSQAVKLPVKTKFKTIGLVSGKSFRSNRVFLELEDPETSITVMVSGEEIVKKAEEILNDQVICVDGLKYKDDLLIANDLYWPDVPMHDSGRADEPVCAIVVGDVHVGSKYFREDLFEKFIKWMNMELGQPASRELASRVKYLVIVGDLVDGIGIYPDQLDELTLTTQQAQYEEAARLLAQLPDYVEIVIIPGNHDAVRRSLPQPPVPESYAPSLYKDRRVHMLPNPSTISLHGVRMLLAHGKALDDILSSTPGHDFHEPIKAIELLLRCRHVAPIYGESTPLAPEKVDRLVIRDVPDVFVMGHIHIYQHRKYKGITLISSGSFQDQTPFQRRMKIDPTPGVISVFNLMNHQNIPLDLERL